MEEKTRCPWCGSDSLYVHYHDHEWGRLNTERCHLFQFILLEGAQAGLNWLTILRKREGYRKCFAQFVPEKVAKLTDADVERLLTCREIIRNRLKIKSAIRNAQSFLQIEKEFGSFDTYTRRFLPFGRPIDNHPQSLSDIPTSSHVSDNMSEDMHRRGFSFFGTTICYSFLQATGYINDHLENCFTRH